MSERKRRVLVVDDDDQIRNMLCYMLSTYGFESVEAADGSAGLTKACSSSFDALVLDNMMPGMSGQQLAQRLLLLGCTDKSRIIMITGGTVPPDNQTFAAEVLRKPFEIDDLVAAIERVTSVSPRAGRELNG